VILLESVIEVGGQQKLLIGVVFLEFLHNTYIITYLIAFEEVLRQAARVRRDRQLAQQMISGNQFVVDHAEKARLIAAFILYCANQV